MDKPKLIIKPQRYTGETTVVSVRMTKEMVAVYDRIASETGRTRNELILKSMEFALEHMEIAEL